MSNNQQASHSQSTYKFSISNAKRIIFQDNKSYAGSMHSSNVFFARPRMVTVNVPLPSDQLHSRDVNKELYIPQQQYTNNKIRTSKYSLLTFIPKNLFEQFRRVANTFFLMLVILQAFPLFATVNIGVAAFPIMFIVFVTALKDAVEDYKRWTVDKVTNNRTCLSLSSEWKNWNLPDLEHSGLLGYATMLKHKISARLNGGKAGDGSTSLPVDAEIEGANLIQDYDWVSKRWQDIRVGDIIKLVNDDPLPADLILLSTSEPDCIAYIETKNLDGESNLKLRQGAIETYQYQSAQQVGKKLRCVIDSEPPTTNMLRYQATMTLYPQEMEMDQIMQTLEKSKARAQMLSTIDSSVSQSGPSIKRIPIDINGVLLRGTVLRNTNWAVGVVVFTGDDTKQMLNSGKTPSKRSKVEKIMNPHVAFNLFFMLALCLVCAAAYTSWARQFDIDSSFLYGAISSNPSVDGLVNFFACLILFQNIVPISLYISVEIVKTIQAFFIYQDLDLYYAVNDTPCNPKSWNLADNLGQIEYIFSDKTGTLTRNIMEFKKVCIDGKVYDGCARADSLSSLNQSLKLSSPSGKSPPYHAKKLSSSQLSFKANWIEGVRESQAQREVTKSLNQLPLPRDHLSPHSAAPEGGAPRKGHRRGMSTQSGKGGAGLKDRFRRLSSQNQKQTEIDIMGDDEIEMAEKNPDSVAVEKTSSSWVDENIESFLTLPEFMGTTHSQVIRDFFTLMAVCHTVLVEDKSESANSGTLNSNGSSAGGASGSNNNSLKRPDTPQFDGRDLTQKPKVIAYKAQSPDEACLVTTAAENGFVFKGREHNSVTEANEILLEILGKEQRYQLLNILEFDSDRKRMSVIVRVAGSFDQNKYESDDVGNKGRSDDSKGDVILFCKGADSIIFDRLMSGQSDIVEKTAKCLEEFAQEGLRTLCLAYRKLPEELYQSWASRYLEIQTQIFPDPSARSRALEKLNDEVETKLVLLGATAIEDKLQDGVPKCIQDLSNAGIKIWVLTGDKLETAINVGFLCGLLKTTDSGENTDNLAHGAMVLIQVKNAKTEDEIQRQLQSANDRFWGQKSHEFSRKRTEFALIIDGQSLKLALENDEMRQLLLEIGCKCKAVVCCRVSPLQKAKVVELVKYGKSVLTLAIGDGANDVSMIQAADIGVGISGEEGLQAATSADYAIAQFRFLTKLLLVHGRWSYSRISYMILNFYLKSVVFTMVLFWFQFYCGYSASVIYEFTYMLFFNLVFTSLPIVVMGIYDQDLESKSILTFKPIYGSEGIKQTFYTNAKFFIYILESLWHSLVCFFIPVWTYGEGPSNQSGLTMSGTHLGTVMAISAIIVVNLSVGLDNHSWTWLIHVAIWGSCAVIFLYTLVYSSIPQSPILGLTPELYPDPQFWLNVVVCIILSLGPRFVYYFGRRQLFPADCDIVEEIQYLVKQGTAKLSQYVHKDAGGHHSGLTSQDNSAQHSIAQSRQGSVSYPATPVEEKNQSLAVPGTGLVRRPSNASAVSSYNMDTGRPSKLTGFSFSHTLGMGGVVTRSPLNLPLNILPFKYSNRDGGSPATGRNASAGKKPRLLWPNRPSSASGNRQQMQQSASQQAPPLSAPPAIDQQQDASSPKRSGPQLTLQVPQKTSPQKDSVDSSKQALKSPLSRQSFTASEIGLSSESSSGERLPTIPSVPCSVTASPAHTQLRVVKNENADEADEADAVVDKHQDQALQQQQPPPEIVEVIATPTASPIEESQPANLDGVKDEKSQS
ncbi:hypothetical protein MP228_001061 [Amoeboaphelidium protococcarum]|nr:hypothetical protein MP228_001061 [Amoeboaphelidium protococcarum]